MKQVTKQEKLNLEIMNLFAQISDSEWLDISYGMGRAINRSVDCKVKALLINMVRNHNNNKGPDFEKLDEQIEQLTYLIEGY